MSRQFTYGGGYTPTRTPARRFIQIPYPALRVLELQPPLAGVG